MTLRTSASRRSEAVDSSSHHGWTSDKNRPRQLLFEHGLRCPQDALVLAFGIDHAHRLGPRLGEYGLHHKAGAEREALKLFTVLLEILDRPRRDARFHRGLRDRGRDAKDQPRIERIWNQRARTKSLHLAFVGAGDHIRRRFPRQCRDRLRRGALHRFVDRGCAAIQRAAE